MQKWTIPLIALLATATPSLAAVVFGPIVNPANGSTYLLLSANSWTASQAEAVSLGGNLVTIDNPAENIFVADTFGELPGVFTSAVYDLWIGLNDSTQEGTFRWVGPDSSFELFSPNSNPNTDINDYWTIVPHRFGATERGPIGENHWNLIIENPGSRLGVVEINAIPEPASALVFLAAAIGLLRTGRRRMQ